MLAKGLDPADRKRRAKQAAKVAAANTFAAVAESYIAKNERDGLAENTVIKRRWLLKTLRKALGHRPLTEIEPFAILDAVRPFEAAKNEEKAQRAFNFVGQVYRFAVANQRATSDPTRDLRGALANPKPKHHAAILEPKKVGELLRAIEGYEGNAVTLFGLRLSALLFVRPGELRMAEWAEIDFDAAVWRIRAERMKGRVEHVVPLSRQAVALLREVQGLTGDGRFVIQSIRTPARPYVGKHDQWRAPTARL